MVSLKHKINKKKNALDLQVQEIDDKFDIDSVAEQNVSSEEKSRSGWYQVSKDDLAISFSSKEFMFTKASLFAY
jgi:hypothetical protein